MGNCCRCSSSRKDEDDDEFTNLEGLEGGSRGGKRKNNVKLEDASKKSKARSSAQSSRSEEVHFEYDEKTQRLVPIIKSHHHRDKNSGTGEGVGGDAKKPKRRPRRTGAGGSTGRSGASLSDVLSDAGSRRTGDGDGNNSTVVPGDIGRSDESLVDCISNNSFDLELDDNTMVRLTNMAGANQQQGVQTPRPLGATSDISGGASGVGGGRDEAGGGGVADGDAGAIDDEEEDEEFTLEDLQELEEISRSEIYAAFMVAVQMLRFAMKKITPTVHFMLDGSHRSGGSQHVPSHGQPNSTSTSTHQQENDQQLCSPSVIADDSSSEFVPSTTTVIQMMKMKKKKKPKTAKIVKKSSQLHQPPEGSPRVVPKGKEKIDGGNRSPQQLIPPNATVESRKDHIDNDNDDDEHAHEDDEEEDDEGSSSSSAEPDQAQVQSSLPAQTQRVQLLELDARSIPCDGSKVKSKFFDSNWDFFNSQSGLAEVSARHLSKGDALYGFKCFLGDTATADDIRLMSPFINLSSFANEVAENNVPHVDFSDKKHLKKFTIIISKAMYLIPGLEKEDVDAAYWASREYCEACIANVTKFEDCAEASTFRMHKPLVRFIFSLVVQLKITEIKDPKVIRSLAQVDGFVPCRALLYERTKRDKTKVDMTVKVKSILLFQQVPGGMLVSNVAAVFNSSIPGIISAIINNFGSSGAGETEEVASRTRKHIQQKFVAPRLSLLSSSAAASATSASTKK